MASPFRQSASPLRTSASAPPSKQSPTRPPPFYMASPLRTSASASASASPSIQPPQSPAGTPPILLQQPSEKRNPSKSKKLYRKFKSVFRSFPIINPTCKIPVSLGHHNVIKINDSHHLQGGTRLTGTIYGFRKGRVSIALQENPRCLPMLVLELAISTGKLLQDMGVGLVRIALECEKRSSDDKVNTNTKIIDEPIWTMYCNGKKSGYGVKREAREDDLGVMQLLHPVSMGAGILPSESNDLPEGELTYMRAFFERVVGSKDSETYYMLNPDGNSGPELSIFFVRV